MSKGKEKTTVNFPCPFCKKRTNWVVAIHNIKCLDCGYEYYETMPFFPSYINESIKGSVLAWLN